VNPLKLEGRWWLPDTPENEETGTLSFDQVVGARLNVVGRLIPLVPGPLAQSEDRDVIHGFTTAGKEVTLLGNFVINSRFGSVIATETWHVGMIALGAHFMSKGDALFERSWTRFDGIARWLAFDPFAETFEFGASGVELIVRKPESVVLGDVDGTQIYTGSSLKWGREDEERWTSSSEAMIAIHAEEPKSLDWHFSKSAKLRALAELLFGRPLHLTKLCVELPTDPVAEGWPHYAEVEIYAQIIGGDDVLPPVDRPPMLSAPELIAAAPDAFADWFGQYETLNAPLRLVSTVASDRRMFSNVRFLLAAQAVETFHRETCPLPIMPAKEHGKLVEALLGAIPENTPNTMRDKLKGTLNYSNEFNLRQRLRALIASARDGRVDAMPAYGKSFIDAVVATRNYETHHGSKPANLLTGLEMYWATRRLVVLLTVLFLRRLGLLSEDIDSLISRHREFNKLWTTRSTP
jgi:ApeA N-terminal domain 1